MIEDEKAGSYVVRPTLICYWTSSSKPAFILCYHTCKSKEIKGYESNSENSSPTHHTHSHIRKNGLHLLQETNIQQLTHVGKRSRPHSMYFQMVVIFWLFASISYIGFPPKQILRQKIWVQFGMNLKKGKGWVWRGRTERTHSFHDWALCCGGWPLGPQTRWWLLRNRFRWNLRSIQLEG